MPADVPRPALLGPYGPAQIACLRSWRQLGLAPLYIYIGSRPLPLASRIAAAVLHLPGALVGTDEGASRVVAFLRDHCADGVTCLAENLAHWLHTMTQRTDWPEAVACWISDAEALERLASKAEQVDIARRVGLKVLPSFLIDHKSAGAVPEDAYPLVLRPDTPGAVAPSFKALRVPDRARLEAFLAEVRRIDRPLVAQRLVVGPNLVVHGARAPTARSSPCRPFAPTVRRMA